MSDPREVLKAEIKDIFRNAQAEVLSAINAHVPVDERPVCSYCKKRIEWSRYGDHIEWHRLTGNGPFSCAT